MNRNSMRPGIGGDQCFMFCSVLLVAHKKDRPVKTKASVAVLSQEENSGVPCNPGLPGKWLLKRRRN